MTVPLPRRPAPAALVLDAHLHLLDRDLVDRDGEPASIVADLELEQVDGRLVVSHLVTSTGLLQRVLGGHTPREELHLVPWRHVADVGVVVRLGVPSSELELTWPEDWVRERLIARIPGGRHAPE